MPNLTLQAARRSRRWSQDDLARAIRDAGQRLGEPNSCTKRDVQRWESGAVAAPRGHHLRALEYAMGEPASNLGFADERYGLDREQAMNLSPTAPVPEPKNATGPLTGIWLSTYTYASSGRSQEYSDRHHVLLLQAGDRITVRSLPGSAPSDLVMDLTQNGAVVTGTWSERTNSDGYYQGSVYHGALQLLLEPSGRRLTGRWLGFGRDWDINDGPWTLQLITSDTSHEAMAQYSQPIEDSGK